jgi:hypothetical protein
MRSKVLSSALVTTVGALLVLAGVAMLFDPVLIAVLFGIPAVTLFTFGLLGGRRAPSDRTPEERTRAWRRFNASRERQTPWLTLTAALLVGGLFFAEGLTDGTLLAALGFAVLAIGSWTFDPRALSEIGPGEGVGSA